MAAESSKLCSQAALRKDGSFHVLPCINLSKVKGARLFHILHWKLILLLYFYKTLRITVNRQMKILFQSVSNIESGGVNARRRSNLELITPDAANEIVALSDTLSYKQVRFRAFFSAKRFYNQGRSVRDRLHFSLIQACQNIDLSTSNFQVLFLQQFGTL